MTNDTRPALAPLAVRRYPLLAGAAAWYLPLLAAMVAVGAVASEALEVALGGAALGWAVHRLTCSLVVEVGPSGLTSGLVGMGTFRARTTLIAWSAVAEVHTDWRRPAGDLALETMVRDHGGRTIRLSTAMGLAAYWACVAEIVRCAPAARRSGLTDAVLAEGPPARHNIASAIGTAAALALVLAALVTVHYLWAQGRSSLVRDLERIGAAGEPRASGCAAQTPGAAGGTLAERCR